MIYLRTMLTMLLVPGDISEDNVASTCQYLVIYLRTMLPVPGDISEDNVASTW